MGWSVMGEERRLRDASRPNAPCGARKPTPSACMRHHESAMRPPGRSLSSAVERPIPRGDGAPEQLHGATSGLATLIDRRPRDASQGEFHPAQGLHRGHTVLFSEVETLPDDIAAHLTPALVAGHAAVAIAR